MSSTLAAISLDTWDVEGEYHKIAGNQPIIKHPPLKSPTVYIGCIH